jgi:hypothetical protein
MIFVLAIAHPVAVSSVNARQKPIRRMEREALQNFIYGMP